MQGHIRAQQTRVCKPPCSSHHREQKCGEGLHRIDGVGGSEMKRQIFAHGFAITYLPQKLEEHHQTTERSDRSLRLAQFHFFSAPKSGNFPMHCFVLLEVSFIQLKLNRVRTKQCYSISEFRFNPGMVESSLPTRSRSATNPNRGLTLKIAMLGNRRARTPSKMCSKNLQVESDCGSWAKCSVFPKSFSSIA